MSIPEVVLEEEVRKPELAVGRLVAVEPAVLEVGPAEEVRSLEPLAAGESAVVWAERAEEGRSAPELVYRPAGS